jgi:hypothetical protein
MKINENVRLVSHDIQSYDIPACHYTILKNHGFDVSHLDKGNKLERNIAIGKMMRENSRITKLLRETTTLIIDDFITQNNIKDDDIVIRQYDGILLKRTVHKTEIGNYLVEHRNSFDVFVCSIKRNSYIAHDATRNVSKIKGVPYRYDKMDTIFKKICLINFAKKTAVFRGLQRIKDEIMTTKDTSLFAIPIKERFRIYLKGYGEIEVTKPTLKIMDPKDIDRQKYFDFYIAPFTKSVVLEYVR